MNESITRAAGAEHGQELAPHISEALAQDLGRVARHRNTFYGDVGDERHQAALQAAPLAPIVNTPLQRAS